MNKCNSKAR